MRTTLIIAAAAGVVALLTVSGQAQAQANRTFVSGLGDDTNPCSLTAPCRSFAGAILKTNAGGEIVVLDSAGYGTVTINQAITISSQGVEGAITTTAAGAAITVNPGVGGNVTLRNLTLIGQGIGTTGILIQGASHLVIIQNCSISGFTGDAITYALTNPGTFNPKLVVDNLTLTHNQGNGITFQPAVSAQSPGLFASNILAIGNNIGILIDGGLSASGINVSALISYAEVAHTDVAGIEATSAAGAATVGVMLTNSRVSASAPALLANSANAIFDVDKTQVTLANVCLSTTNGGKLVSFGNNQVDLCGTTGSFTTTIANQ